MDNKMKIELNRDQIKYIAVFTMLLNHVANIFLQPGTFACEALKDAEWGETASWDMTLSLAQQRL